ncbi:MAG TPA: acetate--CoA ligase family protein [Candidatus Thermoplasmatota archaeon]|nr:acetate--CoA ligase family protein [Candidatus Thermoplasmatota archaeon]
MAGSKPKGSPRRTATPVDAVFSARSIAVVGASRDPRSIGHTIVRNLVRDGFRGTVYPVNPRADHILSIRAYPSVSRIPGPVDLAVICVPAALVEAALEECGRKAVRAAIVITAGFREVGEEGRLREKAVERVLAKFGMRAVGPNCMGCITTAPDVSMNATFALGMPRRGNVAMMSQSGALSAAIMEYARGQNIGFSKFVSMGNILNVDTVDLLEYFGRDKATSVILMYLETFGDAARFASVCRPLSKRKPIMAVKGGRTAAGARAARSHTGALAGSDAAVQSLFDQCGVIRANTLEELFDFTQALSGAPLPNGRQVAIVTDAGGPAIMATDALPACGLALSRLSLRTKERLKRAMPPEASVENPVDMIASADSNRYRRVLKIVLSDEGVDGAIVICVPPVIIDVEATAEAISEVASASGKPVLGVFMGADYASKGRSILESHGVPSFLFPESAVRAFAAMAEYARIRARPVGRVRRFRVDRACARRVLELAHREGREALKDRETIALLAAYGIPMPRTTFAANAEDAILRAREIGYPVALKVSSPKVSHKTEVGGVVLDLRSDAEVFHAYHKLLEKARKHGFADFLEGVIVQQMVLGGQEVIIGATRDVQFGPMVAFGLGGVFAEYFKDVNFRIAPLTDVDARELVRSIRAFPVLEGARGAPPSDVRFLEETALRVSQLVADFPDILSLDLNPFRAFESGKRGLAVDARVFLTPRPAHG